MARLSEEKIQKIRSSVDIVDVIGSYLPLEKKGKGYWAICPFHDDKNPSLSVSPELQIYKCFVCGAGGNVFTFLKEYLKISYIEAVKMCAEMAGIDVSELNDYHPAAKINDEQQPLYQMHDEALKIYHLFLKTKNALAAKEYLNKRHIGEDVIEAFQIGYAPSDDSLLKAFTQLNFSRMDMAKSGLIIEASSHYYDRFKDRIMFPLWDSEGRVVGFSGRIYQPSSDQAKYMNSPESEIFTKGKTLYRYAQSKEAVKKAGFVYLLEGFMDVIALYRAGIENATAIMGTALTKEHLILLRKVTDTIHLCLDGDKPGQDAMMKASKALLEHGFQVRIICLKQGMDPDEMLENFGKEALVNALKSHISVLEFQINYYFENSHMENYDERKQYLERLAVPLSELKDPIDRDYYVQLVAGKSGFSKETILSKINQMQSAMPKKEHHPLIFKNQNQRNPQNKYMRSERELLYYMLKDKSVALRYESELGFLYDDKLRLIANYMIDYYRSHDTLEVADLLDIIDDNEAVKLLLDIGDMKIPETFSKEVIDDYILTIKNFSVKLQIENLNEELKQELDPLKKADLVSQIYALKNQ